MRTDNILKMKRPTSISIKRRLLTTTDASEYRRLERALHRTRILRAIERRAA